MATAPTIMVERVDNAVAATVTGARISTMNGLWMPPVSNIIRPNCSVSKTRMPVA